MSDLNFQTELKLTTAKEYKNVFVNPVRATDQYFTIMAIKNHRNKPRLGLAIAKKNIKKAVNRNLIKRIIRESFRLAQYDLVCFDFVVMARRQANQALSHKLHQSLCKHWLPFKKDATLIHLSHKYL